MWLSLFHPTHKQQQQQHQKTEQRKETRKKKKKMPTQVCVVGGAYHCSTEPSSSTAHSLIERFWSRTSNSSFGRPACAPHDAQHRLWLVACCWAAWFYGRWSRPTRDGKRVEQMVALIEHVKAVADKRARGVLGACARVGQPRYRIKRVISRERRGPGRAGAPG